MTNERISTKTQSFSRERNDPSYTQKLECFRDVKEWSYTFFSFSEESFEPAALAAVVPVFCVNI